MRDRWGLPFLIPVGVAIVVALLIVGLGNLFLSIGNVPTIVVGLIIAFGVPVVAGFLGAERKKTS
ncbi:MAG: hypothetical protein HY685_05710 [Chloroflexi bacterium]|nr:hypothetical protein [Chloroflexota bacterium]